MSIVWYRIRESSENVLSYYFFLPALVVVAGLVLDEESVFAAGFDLALVDADAAAASGGGGGGGFGSTAPVAVRKSE